MKPPRKLQEALEQFNMLRREHPEWIAGTHNYAYHMLGWEDLEPLAVADFYDGVLSGFYGRDPLKNVPVWELERTIRMWLDRLEKVKAPKEEKDRHRAKLLKVLKR